VIRPRGLHLDDGGRHIIFFQRFIPTAEELAESVDTRILKKVCESLDNGKAWECIERRFDYLKEEKESDKWKRR